MTEILPQEDFTELERRDEAQIMAELKGKYLDEFVYQFQSGGRTVTGLSWAGIKEIAYRMGRITVDLVRMEETDQAWIVVTKATDAERGNSRLGVSTQSKTMKGKPDPFSLQKAMSKSQRNAIRPLLPEEMLKTWITKFLEMRRPARKQVKAAQPEPQPRIKPGKRMSKKIIEYNLKAVGFGEDDLAVLEQVDSFIIEPARNLADEEHYKINGALEELGAVWEMVGYRGRWRIPKEA